MPTTARAENHIIRLFVSAYEKGSWKDAALTFPDEVKDGGIDGFAERTDGETLAIEHTVVEPFVGDIADQAEMLPMFPSIEKDDTLLVPGLWIQLFVPVGTLHLQKPGVRQTIVKAVHEWLRANRLALPKGDSEHPCIVAGSPGKLDTEITLTLKIVDLPGDGKLHIRRQQIGDSFGDVIEKMLAKKLPKLVKTAASKRVLLLERRHINLHPKRMIDEIEKRRSSFPDLAQVHEIWIVETMFYGTAFGGEYIRFERYDASKEVASYDFDGTALLTRHEEGVVEIVSRVGGC
jgi:hypothetical protein